MKRPFLPHPQGKITVSLLGLALFFGVFLLGCGGGAETPGEGETAGQQQGILVCSEECAARGQCGTTVTGNQTVILGHPSFPAVQNHQITFPAESTLPIIGSKDEQLQVVSTQEQFNHTFFLVQRADEQVGWVAGWCINPQ